jgi:hypothetical protein
VIYDQYMKEPLVYFPEDVEKSADGTFFLPVVLAQQRIELPMENKGTHENPVWIAWFDPQIEVIERTGAIELSQHLKDLQPSLVITPRSSKSEEMMKRAIQLASVESNTAITLLIMHGSKDVAEIKRQIGPQGVMTSYHPITSPVNPKYLGLSLEQQHII